MSDRKTPVGSRFVQQLIKVNDQLCFAALQQWELEQRLSELVATKPSAYTPQAFQSNPFAQRIHRPVRDLPKFLRDNDQIALRMGVIAGVEYSLAYIEDVQTFRRIFGQSTGDAVKHDAEEEQLRQKIELWTGSRPTPGYFLTLGYLRLLRNFYVHMNETPHAALTNYIRKYGEILNRFWDNGVTDLQGIDFKVVAIRPLASEITFGIMNVLRISLLEVDKMVSETFSLREVVLSVLQDSTQFPPNPQIPLYRVASKVKGRINLDWNWDVSLPEVTRVVEELR